MNTRKKSNNYLHRRKTQNKRKKTKQSPYKRYNLGGSFWGAYGRGTSVMVKQRS